MAKRLALVELGDVAVILQSFDVSNKSVLIFANLFDVCDKFKINLVFFN